MLVRSGSQWFGTTIRRKIKKNADGRMNQSASRTAEIVLVVVVGCSFVGSSGRWVVGSSGRWVASPLNRRCQINNATAAGITTWPSSLDQIAATRAAEDPKSHPRRSVARYRV